MRELTKLQQQLQKQMDDFSTFVWRGSNSFSTYGAFIISEKRGDLKFYNGPDFTNEYSTSQYSSSPGELLGVNFSRKPISFKVAMCDFTIDQWQDFLEWINPHEVEYLTFSFAPKYCYLVKLSKMEDTPRYIIRTENGVPYYYTEMTLSWELQGEACVRSNSTYSWTKEIVEDNSSNNKTTITYRYDSSNQDVAEVTRIRTPLILEFSNLSVRPWVQDLTISLEAIKDVAGAEVINRQLFSVTLKNFSYRQEGEGDEIINLSSIKVKYDSETGVLLYSLGDVNWKLLHLTMTDSNGDYIVQSINVSKFKLEKEVSDYEFIMTITNGSIEKDNCQLIVYERTNVI